MKPLYAIAPLALVLALIGPARTEADQAISRLKDRLLDWAPAMLEGSATVNRVRPLIEAATQR
jgi:hypothetical protein